VNLPVIVLENHRLRLLEMGALSRILGPKDKVKS
jgi:hypothetical protein